MGDYWSEEERQKREEKLREGRRSQIVHVLKKYQGSRVELQASDRVISIVGQDKELFSQREISGPIYNRDADTVDDLVTAAEWADFTPSFFGRIKLALTVIPENLKLYRH